MLAKRKLGMGRLKPWNLKCENYTKCIILSSYADDVYVKYYLCFYEHWSSGWSHFHCVSSCVLSKDDLKISFLKIVCGSLSCRKVAPS